MSAEVLCTSCESELEPGDLRCPVCTAGRAGDQPQPTVPQAQVLRCTDCNAVMRYDEQAQAATCPFCGAKLELERPTDPVEQAQAFVPFRVDRQAAAAAFRAWLSKKSIFAPGDLEERARLTAARPVLWASWIVTGTSEVHFTADERGAGHKADWGPRVLTFSRPLNGLLVPATRGLDIGEIASLHTYDLTTAQDAAPAGVVLEDFGVTRSAARRAIGQAVCDDAIATAGLRSKRPQRRQRVEILLSKVRTRRVLLPAWIAAYRYRDKVFRVVLHGQYPRSVVGTRPVSPWRVAIAVLAVVALVAALVAFLALRSQS